MSTSKLQRYTGEQLYKRFGKYGLIENTRPHWLVSSRGERLELDFFIDKLSIAIEVQGKQHFEFTPVFHKTCYDFEEQLRRDTEKQRTCERLGITLLYIENKSDIPLVLYEVYARIDSRLQDGRSMAERPAKNIWIKNIQDTPDNKHHQKWLKAIRHNGTEQEYFDKLIHRLTQFLNSTTNITPSEESKRKTRQKLRFASYLTSECQLITSEKQKEIIRKAMEGIRQ